MRVFVLGTGRCGTMTFVRACQHLDNFSAGHETLSNKIGSARFEYPDQHIEADNRLSWMLGELGRRFDDERTLYVHLRRDRDEVAESFRRRWDSPNRAGIIRAFAHGIVTRRSDWPDDEIIRVCEHYVDVVTSNIDDFVRHRRHTTIWLHQIEDAMPPLLSEIGATGDVERLMNELSVRHNAS